MENIKEKIEDKIIDLIALGAGGRLVSFKPENSDKDLIVEKKGDYKNKTIALNIYGDKYSEVKQVANIKPEENFYLVFVHFNIVKQNIEDKFLVIPSSDFNKIAADSDISKFLTNKKDFVSFLINTLIAS